MDEFPGLLHRDFGLRPQGKGAPMSSSKSVRFGSGSAGGDLFGGDFQRNRPDNIEDNDFFTAPPKYSSANPNLGSDPFFGMGAKPVDSNSSTSMPVFDKPVYDDEEDIFSGVPGLKKGAKEKSDVFGKSNYENDLLAGLGSSNGASRSGLNDDILPSSKRFSPSFEGDLLDSLGGGKGFAESRKPGFSNNSPPSFEDDLLAGFSGVSRHSSKNSGSQKKESVSGFDDLIPGFGGSSNRGLRRYSKKFSHYPIILCLIFNIYLLSSTVCYCIHQSLLFMIPLI